MAKAVKTQTMPLPCLYCMQPFLPKRSTAKFCGGTCRQRWNRKQKQTPGTPQSIEAETKADIDNLNRAIQGFTSRYKLGDLAGVDFAPLEDALEELSNFFLCENCDERRANGWDSVEYCRKCEIDIFELRCAECETRKPSVKSDDMQCRQCEKE